MRVLQAELVRMPMPTGNELLEHLPVLRGEALQASKAYLDLFEGIQKQYDELDKLVGTEVLHDLSQVPSFLDGNARLKQLVGPDVSLARLAEALNRLTAILDQLEQLAEPFEGLSAALGAPVAQIVTPSESGLKAFGAIVDIVSSLNPTHWKLRCDVLDNDDLDELQPRLR